MNMVLWQNSIDGIPYRITIPKAYSGVTSLGRCYDGFHTVEVCTEDSMGQPSWVEVESHRDEIVTFALWELYYGKS